MEYKKSFFHFLIRLFHCSILRREDFHHSPDKPINSTFPRCFGRLCTQQATVGGVISYLSMPVPASQNY